MTSGVVFDWTVRTSDWEPKRRPRPPFGPTALEVMRSCPLRLYFESSPGYELRLSFDARIGIAFHRTLEALKGVPPDFSSGVRLAEWVRERFLSELRVQEAEADQRPRERGMPRSEVRRSAAVEALLETAHRIARPVGTKPVVVTAAHAPQVEVEIPVASRDGLFKGYIDRAEHMSAGTRLLDFKSALRDDLPARYERQLRLYAFMWWETRGEWPAAADVVYPLVGSVHPVSVEAEACESVAAEGVALVREVLRTRRAADLGRPGEVCQVCSFRPWCAPFWKMQAQGWVSVDSARARMGVEGVLETLDWQDRLVKAAIRYGTVRAELLAPSERFPQLARATLGMRVRLLDAEFRGMRHRPRVRVTDYTELYLVDPEPVQGDVPAG